MKLRRLLARPSVLTGAGNDVWHFLRSGAGGLKAGHPLSLATARLLGQEGAPRRGSVAPGVDLLDLGADVSEPGVILCLAEEAAEGPRGHATWVVWGLSRPSVNLSVGPLLGRLSSEILTENHDVELETAIYKIFSDNKITKNVKVEQVMTPLGYRIYPETPITEIQNLMLRRRVSAVPVVGASHELLGVVTIGGVLPHILPGRDSGIPAGGDIPLARQIMTRSVLCVSEDESLVVASRSMIARGVPMLPVVRDGELIGFLERLPVMRAFAEAIVTGSS